MSTKFLHTFRAGVGFVCVSQVTEACAQQMASLHPSACSALSIIGTDIDIEEFWLADWHWKALTQTSMLKKSMLTVVKNAPNLLSNLAPILPIFEKMEKNGLYFIFGEKPLKGSRLEICHDRRNRPSCKFFSSCVNFSSKQHIPLQNLCQNINFTHLFGKITHTFTHTYIFISISTKKGQN